MLFVTSCNSQTKEEMLQSGIELLGEGNLRGSIVYFKNALDKDPNYYEARYYLADAYLKSGFFERSESEFKKVSLQSSSFIDLPLKFSEIYLLTSREKLAIQTLEKFHVETAPTSESLYVQGRVYTKIGDYEKAETSFLEAINLGPENPYPKLHLAALFIQQARHEEAYPILLSITEQNQQFVPGYELNSCTGRLSTLVSTRLV
jgi:tetratricopeptide (TPR) repeat protein